jgi:hypothetical protein
MYFARCFPFGGQYLFQGYRTCLFIECGMYEAFVVITALSNFDRSC